MKALAQWKKIWSISMSSARIGRFPRTTISSKNGASRSTRARPLIRSVSLRPGMSEMIPTCGVEVRLGEDVAVPVGALVTWPFGDGDARVVEHVDQVTRRVALGRGIAVAVR